MFGELALFLWVRDAMPDRLWGVRKQHSGTIMETSLSKNADIVSL
jgi:uncharacterized membrane protein